MVRHILTSTNRADRHLTSRRVFLRQSGVLLAGASLFSLYRANNALQIENGTPLISQAIDDFVTKWLPVGLATAVIFPGATPKAIPVVKTFFRGEIKQGDGQVPTEKTIFELGSITKIFTASLLADMVYNQKVIALDDDVQPYYDKLAPGRVQLPTYQGQAIKFWHLATHTAGFPDDPPNLKDGSPCQYTPDLMYAALGNLKLAQAPGKVDSYSNLGFGTLADVLCLISGDRPYEDVIRDLFTKAALKLPDTHVMTADFKDTRFAQGYTYDSTKKVVDANKCMPTWPAFDGAGALHSTLTDMIEWVKFYMGTESPLSPISNIITEAIKPLHSFGKNEKIGLGWQLRPLTTQPGKFVITKNGGTLGFSSDIVFFPETGTAAISLTNTTQVDVTALDNQLIELLNPAAK